MVPVVSRRIPPLPRYSGSCYALDKFLLRGSHPLRPNFPVLFEYLSLSVFSSPSTPIMPQHFWFGLLPFRSPLLRESLLFSPPAGTKMFQFPAFAFRSPRNIPSSSGWVTPFGHRRISGHLHLPDAFRSLSRPSSPLRALGIPRAPFLTSFIGRSSLRSSLGILSHIVVKEPSL